MSTPCPVCHGTLTPRLFGHAKTLECGPCGGVWIAPGSLDAITGRSIEAGLAAQTHPPRDCRYCQTPAGFGTSCSRCGKATAISCPFGHGAMNSAAVSFADHEFEIDRCVRCQSLWVDGHEVEYMHTTPGRELVYLPKKSRENFLGTLGHFSAQMASYKAFPLWEWGAHNPAGLLAVLIVFSLVMISLTLCTWGAPI